MSTGDAIRILYSPKILWHYIFTKSLKLGYLHLNFHEMLADGDLNFYKKLTKFTNSELYFQDSKFSCKIHENKVPQKFWTIR